MEGVFSDYKFYYRFERHDAALCVCSIGYDRSRGSYYWGQGSRAYYIIQHVVAGEGILQQGGEVYQLRAGDTFITFPHQQEIVDSKAKGWEYLWIGLAGMEATMLLHKLGFSKEHPIQHTGDDPRMRFIHREIYKARGPRLSDSLAMTGQLYLLFSHLIDQMGIEDQQEESDKFQQVLAYIDSHITQSLRLEDLCREINISRSHLYRMFMRYIGVPPTRYITEMKITYSCSLLLDSGKIIGEVAYAMGFSDPLYFSRVFKSIMGITPSQYRKAQKEAKKQEKQQ